MNPLDTTRGEAESSLQRSAGIPVDPYKDWSEKALAALEAVVDASANDCHGWDYLRNNALAAARAAIMSFPKL